MRDIDKLETWFAWRPVRLGREGETERLGWIWLKYVKHCRHKGRTIYFPNSGLLYQMFRQSKSSRTA